MKDDCEFWKTAAANEKDRVKRSFLSEVSNGYLLAGTGSALTMRAMLFSMVSLGT